MQALSDETVMLEYQKGDMTAMDELLARYKNPVFHFSLRLVHNSAEAQDITQEVFLRIHQQRLHYQPIGKFSTWIFSIAHNICVSHLRKQKWLIPWQKKGEDTDQPMDVASHHLSPEEEVAVNDTCAIVKKCISSLPFLQREALILREYQRLDYQEIACILKKSLGTVKTLIHRARMNLKERLLPYVEEGKGGL